MSLYKYMLFGLLALIVTASSENSEEMELALDTDESCDAEGCGLELRQLRGELKTSLKKEVETCGEWLKSDSCDEENGEVPKPASTQCEDDECSQDTCCDAKASCSFFTVMGGCAKMAVPANVTKKVWVKKAEDLDVDLYCASTEQNEESCGESCCELKPCITCSGDTYPVGCKAGSIGSCEVCPTESSCSSGQYQTCGEGILGECQSCKNAPENAHYTGSSMTGECPWACNKYYEHQDGKCVPDACASWTGKCDAATQVTLDPSTSCKGDACSVETCCGAKATCSQYYSSAAPGASATCALVKDATSDGKVWAPAVGASTLYCTGAEANAANCEKTCCSLQPCMSCSGKRYTEGCQAGSVGTCASCPSTSNCSKGEFQNCGEGVLGECQTCSNAPAGAVYTGSAMEETCPWKCDAGYIQAEGLDRCDATCALYECSKERYLMPVPDSATILQHAAENDKVCCQSAGCGLLNGKAAMSEATLAQGGCKALTTQATCDETFVVSGNQKRDRNDGATIFTPCAWDASASSCNWGTDEYTNCLLEHIDLKKPDATDAADAAETSSPADSNTSKSESDASDETKAEEATSGTASSAAAETTEAGAADAQATTEASAADSAAAETTEAGPTDVQASSADTAA